VDVLAALEIDGGRGNDELAATDAFGSGGSGARERGRASERGVE
jgi:hypothetical protein